MKTSITSGCESLMRLCGPAAAMTGPAHATVDESSLKALAQAKGLWFGTAISARKMGLIEPAPRFGSPALGANPISALRSAPARDSRFEQLLKEECSIIVPENEFKMYAIRREPNVYDFTAGDAIVAFSIQSGLRLRGHTLLWNRPDYMAQWVKDYDFGPNPRAGAEVFLREYIQRVCTHFGDIPKSWDVVNESIDPLTGELRETPFSRNLGFHALRIAFEAAREYAPHAQLVYNDYMSFEPHLSLHRNAVLKLLHDFRTNNVPVDALGVQSHICAVQRIADADRREWISFLDEVVGMGYKLLITEFDIDDLGAGNDIPTRDSAVAAAGRDYLDLMLSYRQLDQFLCWGLVDKHSWMQSIVASHRPPLRPNPYDEDYQSKPLREAIAAAISAAPMRQG